MPFDRLLRYWAYQFFAPETLLREKYKAFKKILQADRQAHLFMARLEEIFYQRQQVDCSRVDLIYNDLSTATGDMVAGLLELSPGKYSDLKDYFKKIDFYCRLLLAPMNFNASEPYVFLPDRDGEGNENLLGGKGVNLNRLHAKLHLPVPGFFIVTTNAFCCYLETHSLIPEIEAALSQVDIQEPESLEMNSDRILRKIDAADVPQVIASRIQEAMEKVFRGRPDLLLSVRSSAVAEDRESSFAGQYVTMLKVEPEQILPAYKRVLKSKYYPSPIYYRIKRGYCDLGTPMAVIVQEMIKTTAAGVGYSRDPDRPGEDFLTIYAAAGLGERVVSGSVIPEVIRVDRKTGKVTISPGSADRPSINKSRILADKDVERLAEWLLVIEQYLGHPADMEWCLDSSGVLKVLQARILTVPELQDKNVRTPEFAGMQAVLKGGVPASGGCGAGQVHKITRHMDLASTPWAAVLVARHAPPDFVEIFERVAAIVTEKGSAASHAASVARELGIPFLCNVPSAMDNLREGQKVTVDADSQVIYQGISEHCKKENRPGMRRPAPDNPLFIRLKQLLKMVSELSLVDVDSKQFTPGGCRSIHDVIRFVHECAMREMFSLGKGMKGKRGARRLVSSLPLIFYVLDVGGGLRENIEEGQDISIEEVLSKPMRAFWQGLSDPSVKWSETEHFAWGEYEKIILAGGWVSKDSASLSSYAVVASDYMNLSIRFGYHFVQIDAFATGDVENNSITFRFSGGGGRPEGKLLRTAFIVNVLTDLGFKAESTGELVDARMKHVSEDEILSVLVQVGRLVGATRLMDIHLSPASDIKKLTEDFLSGRSDFSRDTEG